MIVFKKENFYKMKEWMQIKNVTPGSRKWWSRVPYSEIFSSLLTELKGKMRIFRCTDDRKQVTDKERKWWVSKATFSSRKECQSIYKGEKQSVTKSIMYSYDVIQIYIKILYINIKLQLLIIWEKLNEFSTSWKKDDEI